MHGFSREFSHDDYANALSPSSSSSSLRTLTLSISLLRLVELIFLRSLASDFPQSELLLLRKLLSRRRKLNQT